MKVYIKNQQRLIKVNQQRITRLLTKALRLLGLHRAELSIFFVNDIRMRILNREYRGVDRTTDVLSFTQIALSSQLSALSSQHFILGDIVINLHKANRQAMEYGTTLNEELKRLLIHGLLHLIGYDHEMGKYADRKMQKKAQDLFNKIKL
jgi:probable rRNA maturation factor